jgi:hypothetical protein
MPIPFVSYKLEGDAIDSSTNGFNGTVNGATAAVDRFGEASKAMSFIGGATISLPIDFTTVQNFTMSVWLQRQQDFHSYVVFNDGWFKGFGLAWGWPDGKTGPGFFAGNGDWHFIDAPPLVVPIGDWIHVVATVSSSGTISQYINGVLVGTGNTMGGPIAWVPGNPTVLSFSATMYGNNSPTEVGRVDDLQFYDVALSASEVTNLYQAQAPTGDMDNDGVNNYREGKDGTNPNDSTSFNPLSKGLVAYYPFQGNTNDESGYDNHLVNLTVGASISGDRFGNANGSLKLHSTEDSAVSSRKTGISGNQAHTVSLWFSLESVPAWNPKYIGSLVTIRAPEADRVGGESRILLQKANGQSFISAHGAYSDLAFWAQETSFNKSWNHLLFSYSSSISTSSIYVNGVRVHATSEPGFDYPRNLLDGFVFFGRTPLADGSFADGVVDGKISDVRVYNRAISETEARQMYYDEALNDFQRNFLISNPSLMGHHSQSQFEDNRAAGRQDVLSDPAAYDLFTAASIMDLNLGGLMLQKQGDSVTLNLEIQKTDNLGTTPFAPFENISLPVTMPGNKGFLRVRAIPNP